MGAGGAALGLQAAGGAVGAYGAMESGRAQAAYYGFLGSQNRIQAQMAKATGERQASDIEQAAGYDQEIMARNAAKVMGAQRAAFAANGIAGSVTAQDITNDTLDKAALDREAVRFNADSKANAARLAGANAAFNYQTQSAEDAMAGTNAMSAARWNAAATVLGSGGSLASQWYRMN